MADENENYFARFRAQKPTEDDGELSARLVFRLAQQRDLQGLAALHLERRGGLLEQHQENYRKEMRENPDWQRRLLLVAEHESALVGFGRVLHFEPPPDSPANIALAGWYLAGVVVTPAFRRRGVGAALTRLRLEWIAARAEEAFYFVNAQNRASIALHSAFDFKELTQDFVYPGVSFMGGRGALYRATLHSPAQPST